MDFLFIIGFLLTIAGGILVVGKGILSPIIDFISSFGANDPNTPPKAQPEGELFPGASSLRFKIIGFVLIFIGIALTFF